MWSFNGESYLTRAELDSYLSLAGAKLSSGLYFDTSKLDTPLFTPLQQDLAGLPDMLIQVGNHEMTPPDWQSWQNRQALMSRWKYGTTCGMCPFIRYGGA